MIDQNKNRFRTSYMVEKIDADEIGLKHYLGSTENMRNS